MPSGVPMTLHVPIEQFSGAVKRVIGGSDAYVGSGEPGSIATAFDAAKRVRLMARDTCTPKELIAKLEKEGMKVHEGCWSDPGDGVADGHAEVPYVASVSYRADRGQPGVWVDAFPSLPTPAQALRALYDEFRDTGELGDVSFEEFVRLSEPNVVIVTPTELLSFAEAKEAAVATDRA